MPMGFRFFIAAHEFAVAQRMLPVKAILPTLTVGPSLMTNVSATRAGGMVLTSVRMTANWWPCSPSISCNTTSARLTRGLVELALDVEGDLLLLEAVHDVGDGDRVQALVVDLADGGLFANVDLQLEAALAGNLLDADVVEVAGVPERVEVALNDGRVIGVAGAG